ncbi:MAG: hypothetical protein RL318_919 [Fibrobacterota bacterium]|jgi:hypothetical protein
MEVSEQAALVGLAVFLLAIHVAGSVLVLRTLRTTSHHMKRLDELYDMEMVLLKRGTRRGVAPVPGAPEAGKVTGSLDAASTILKSMLKESN